MLREGQILYTYLHLAPDPEQTTDLVKSGVTAIAYETPYHGFAADKFVAGRPVADLSTTFLHVKML